MEYLKNFYNLFQLSTVLWMITYFASATLSAIFIEYLILKKESTLYKIYKLNISYDLKKDICIWAMEIILVWPLIGRIFTLSLGVYFGSLLSNWFSSLSSLKLISLVPIFWIQVLLAFALGDLVLYWLHRLFHYGNLWQLHKYHHSTTEMTVFSGSRDNPAVGQLWALVTGIPSAILGGPAGVPEMVVFINILHTQIIHSKLNHHWGYFGKYIIVSPGAHLIHHSAHPEHRDKNFSFIFPIWDHLFGTWYGGKNLDTSILGLPDDPQHSHPIKQVFVNYMMFLKLELVSIKKYINTFNK